MGGPEEKVIFMQGGIMHVQLQPGGEAWEIDPLWGPGKGARCGLREKMRRWVTAQQRIWFIFLTKSNFLVKYSQFSMSD